MTSTYYKHGDYNVICDRTGFKAKRSDCAIQWDGLLVLKDHWERRHPQDKLRGFKDDQSVPTPRPEGTWNFLSTNEVQPEDL
jgi:hypothetical protein